MKKFTLLAFAALFTFAASAQKVVRQQNGGLTRSLERHELPQSLKTNSSVASAINAEKAQKLRSITPVTMSSNGMLRVDGDGGVISETPAGREVVSSKSCDSYYSLWGYVFNIVVNGAISNVVYGEDNTVYIKNPFSSLATDTWIKGTVDGEDVTITLPQPVLQGEVDGEVLTYYANRLAYNGDEGWYYVDETSQDIKLTLRNDSLFWNEADNGDVILGLTDDSGEWFGYGDYNIDIVPMTDTAVEAPAGLQTEDWVMTYGGVGHMVKVGFDGNDVYVGNFYESLPDSWIKGTVDGDKVVFEGGQYIGADNGYYVYLKTASSALVWDDYFGDCYTEYYPTESIVLAYDAENKVMTTDSTMIVNAGNGDLYSLALYDAPTIKYQAPIVGAVKPATPVILDHMAYDVDYGYGALLADIPIITEDGLLLDANKIHYNMFVDDEIFTFYSDEYIYLDFYGDEMTDVPYYFSDGYDIYYEGTLHYVYFYFTGYEKIGIRCTYTADNGETADSEIGWYYVNATGISAVTGAETGVKNVSYTDLSGRRVNAKSKGLLIKTVTYDDGTVKSYKFINK